MAAFRLDQFRCMGFYALLISFSFEPKNDLRSLSQLSALTLLGLGDYLAILANSFASSWTQFLNLPAVGSLPVCYRLELFFDLAFPCYRATDRSFF
jgi:hypothetical protein